MRIGKVHADKTFFLSLLLMLAGINVMTFGVAAFYASRFGSDTGSVFCDGLHILLKISRGTAMYIYNGTLILALLLFGRKFLRPAMFVHYFLSGALVDMYSALLARLGDAVKLLPVRIFLMLLGLLCVCVGIGMFIAPGYGGGVYESFLMLLQDKLHRRYSTLRWITDGCLTLTGWLMGGSVGLGTVLCVLVNAKGIELSVGFLRRKMGLDTAPASKTARE